MAGDSGAARTSGGGGIPRNLGLIIDGRRQAKYGAAAKTLVEYYCVRDNRHRQPKYGATGKA